MVESKVVTLTVIEHTGIEHVVQGEARDSVMQVITANDIPGLVGECGGSLACATCHAYVDAAWVDRIPPAGPDERMMLEGALDVAENSRLTCQLTLTPELEGIVFRLPASQY